MAAAAPPPPAGAGPPPPPPPAIQPPTASSSGGGDDSASQRANLFASINKGADITKGKLLYVFHLFVIILLVDSTCDPPYSSNFLLP